MGQFESNDYNNFWNDSTLKREALKYIWEINEQVRPYLTHAVEYVNTCAGEPKELFWANLFCPSRNGKNNTARPNSIMAPNSEYNSNHCPNNPYRVLDMQAVCKYLYYGRYRELPAGVQDDSRYYFNFFLNGFQKSYLKCLSDAIQLRNKKNAHTTDNTVSEFGREDLERAYNIYFNLTQCLARKDQWRPEGMKKVEVFWKEKQKEKERKFGAAPFALEELGQELFSTEELSDEQKSWLNEAAQAMRMAMKDGIIYGELDREKVLEELRELYKKNAELTEEAAEQAQKAVSDSRAHKLDEMEQMEEREAQLAEPIWDPIPEKPGKLLRKAGYRATWSDDLWNAMLDSFVLLVDETILLSREGREMLRSLIPVLSRRKQRLSMDASVIATIFKQFRSSKPYTELETVDMDPDEIEEMQTLRSELHKSAKTAIKTLHYMQECACLEVVSSPTDRSNSYENLRYLVRVYPAVRFLVFTLDRQLVEELAEVKGANAVAVKPGLDHNWLFFRLTREQYTLMLQKRQNAQEEQPEQTAVQQENATSMQPETAAQSKTEKCSAEIKEKCLKVRQEPKSRDTVKAVFPDGNSLILQLEKFISDGGEGAIYQTSRAELVAKVYLPEKRLESRLEKLKSMIAAEPGIDGLCWPRAMLYNQWDEWIGFVMPRAEGVELAKTVFSAGRNCVNVTKMGWSRKHLVAIAGNIADVFSQMHQKNILMGDINPRNFMVRENCTVCFVDCDSYQFADFSCPVFSPLFLPPEIHRAIRSGQEKSSGFLRTTQNELYSLAVLLFEILMLGKAPYESRNTNNDDVVQAIIDGNFPYPYSGGTESEQTHRSNIMPPVGKWRIIWSNMPYLIKTDFYNAFTGKSRCSAAEWREHLDVYLKLIEEDRSSNELLPNTFKVVVGQNGEEITKMLDLTCSNCGRLFNQAENVFRARRARKEEILCEECRSRFRNYRNRKHNLTCDICGKVYEGTVADWMEHEQNGKLLTCPECLMVEVRCSGCGKTYLEYRAKLVKLQERGKEPLCSECFHKQFVEVTCSQCGSTYFERNEQVQYLQRFGVLSFVSDAGNVRKTET